MINPVSLITQAVQSANATRAEGNPATARNRAAALNDTTSSGGVSSTNGSAAEQGGSANGESSIVPSGIALKDTFLTLLVAQIKNQNPLNPADGTEFLSQLAQFTQVEQLISIREELEALGRQNQALSEATARNLAAP